MGCASGDTEIIAEILRQLIERSRLTGVEMRHVVGPVEQKTDHCKELLLDGEFIAATSEDAKPCYELTPRGLELLHRIEGLFDLMASRTRGGGATAVLHRRKVVRTTVYEDTWRLSCLWCGSRFSLASPGSLLPRHTRGDFLCLGTRWPGSLVGPMSQS